MHEYAGLTVLRHWDETYHDQDYHSYQIVIVQKIFISDRYDLN